MCESIWNSTLHKKGNVPAPMGMTYVPLKILHWLLAFREEWETGVKVNMLITIASLLCLHPMFQKQFRAGQGLCLL